jgi:hypothetical protein
VAVDLLDGSSLTVGPADRFSSESASRHGTHRFRRRSSSRLLAAISYMTVLLIAYSAVELYHAVRVPLSMV